MKTRPAKPMTHATQYPPEVYSVALRLLTGHYAALIVDLYAKKRADSVAITYNAVIA
jgi:hypothetical protein